VSDPNGHLRHAMEQIIDDPIPPLQPFRAYLIATYGEANARAMTRSVVGAFNDIIAAGGDVSLSQAHQIACPTLLITGEHDPFAPPPLLAQLAARIPTAETHEVPAAGHDPHHTHTAWLVQTIINWLGKQPSR
jgi:pimeloyl-ACP methyl ester carboxylesterase